MQKCWNQEGGMPEGLLMLMLMVIITVPGRSRRGCFFSPKIPVHLVSNLARRCNDNAYKLQYHLKDLSEQRAIRYTCDSDTRARRHPRASPAKSILMTRALMRTRRRVFIACLP